jgi:type IV secretory pathway VirB4 component
VARHHGFESRPVKLNQREHFSVRFIMVAEYLNDEARGKAQRQPSLATAVTSGAFLDTRSDLVKKIQKLEDDASELGQLRAAIVLNFSEQRATDGIVIKEHPSVVNMLVQVIEAYRKKLTAYQAAVSEIEDERLRLQQMYDEFPGSVEHRAAESILDALDTLKRSQNGPGISAAEK